ncbi:MAG: rhodanese-like domain-containing protein [Bacteroidia bacterium]|nr:rhodanese-like domain-containing protein [Bacteroidia bacterium]NND24741.1 rhodanese-like domain-containing protein [Flavobacteriaceae bacterium]MBT8277836.1 rhodanese-like domain-containing protein [Bacteroidia bacterium]NNK59080.1 rhodanese-like domain-containing protein [Flavobacteriaceae bacterium]NNL31861.1 rhodanese-like domain-containing protein [Flavobacteriaceae bacterium]
MSIFSKIFGHKSKNLNVKVLSPETYKTKISNNKVQLVDVRTALEFKSGHLKNARNINFYSSNFVPQFNKLNKAEPLFIYCRSGSRSHQASFKLAELGFEEIYDLKGGLLNWKA